MSGFLKEISISTWDQLIERLNGGDFKGWMFRGQKCANWELKSSLERAVKRFEIPEALIVDKEKGLIRRFKRQAYQYLDHLPDSGDIVEWLALMQHYGAPTRLLDWTYSFWVAIYFAIESAKPGDCFSVWAIDPTWCRDKAKGILQTLSKEMANKLDCDENFKKPETIKSILFAPKAISLVIPLNPLRLNERLVIQQGVFLAPGDVTRPLMGNIPGTAEIDGKLVKFKISCNLKFLKRALAELHRMNINRASLFPGLAGFAKHLELLIPLEPALLAVDGYWDGSLLNGA